MRAVMAIRNGARGLRWRRVAIAAMSLIAIGAFAAVRYWQQSEDYDPLAVARADELHVHISNVLAHIPPQCYTRTDGVSNPCWVCHTTRNNRNLADDWELQSNYVLNQMGRTNHWTGLFEDRRAAIADISDAAINRYIKADNYTPLRKALQRVDRKTLAWVPDLDLIAGFDDQGFARDGSDWRALRYKPFPGTFWPTNGSTDDVAIRLPEPFRRDAEGKPSREVYQANLAILEAAIAVPDDISDEQLDYPIEPVDEIAAAVDLDGDGRIAGQATRIHGLPAHYVGAANAQAVVRYSYPIGTEFFHTLHYVDPEAPDWRSLRVKEVRYSTKIAALTDRALQSHAARDALEQKNGGRPAWRGDPFRGLHADSGWRFLAYIEDREGRLRLQTHEEHLYCMGCHNGVGVTVDNSYSLPRKVPGSAGWMLQSLVGIHDQPQSGSTEPETLRYLERVGGGDEFRANEEMLARFFPSGQLDRAAVLRAAPDGDQDLRALILPSRVRAMQLNKAYLTHVHAQDYTEGRDALLTPPEHLYRRIEQQTTQLEQNDRIYQDGRIWLDWSAPTHPSQASASSK